MWELEKKKKQVKKKEAVLHLIIVVECRHGDFSAVVKGRSLTSIPAHFPSYRPKFNYPDCAC